MYTARYYYLLGLCSNGIHIYSISLVLVKSMEYDAKELQEVQQQMLDVDVDPTQTYHLLLLVQERLTKVNATSSSSDLTSSQVEYGQLLDLEHILSGALEREQ